MDVLLKELREFKQSKIKKVLNFLLEENLVSVSVEGLLKRNDLK